MLPTGQSRFQSQGRGFRNGCVRASARMVAPSTHKIPQAHRQSVAGGVRLRSNPSPNLGLPTLGGVVPVGTPSARAVRRPLPAPSTGVGTAEPAGCRSDEWRVMSDQRRVMSDEWRVTSDQLDGVRAPQFVIPLIPAFTNFMRPLGVRPLQRFEHDSNRDAQGSRPTACSHHFLGGPPPATHRRSSGKNTPAVVAPLHSSLPTHHFSP